MLLVENISILKKFISTQAKKHAYSVKALEKDHERLNQLDH